MLARRTPEDSDGESEDCLTDAAGEFEDNPDADIQFQKGSFLPFVGAAVTTYDDGAAGDALDTLVVGFNACDGFTQTEDDGTETTWSVQPLSFPRQTPSSFLIGDGLEGDQERSLQVRRDPPRT